MKRNGFTLIELLAVILILGVISLIAIPIIGNIIEEAKEGAAKSSIINYIDAVERLVSENAIIGKNIITDGVYTPAQLDDFGVGIKGNKPETGWVTIVNNEITEAILYLDGFVMEYLYGEIYSKEKYVDKIYKEPVLKGTDPIINGDLVPVIIQTDGTVIKANLSDNWYNYMNKEWANAVILVDKTKTYNGGEEIPLSNIQSYFVWVPKYKYKLFDMGNYNDVISVDPETSSAREIEIVFGTENTSDEKDGECTTPLSSKGSGNCKVGDFMTNPSFITFDVNGYWVGKFEVNGTMDAVTVLPTNNYLLNKTAPTMFNIAYNYNRNLDSHMMKNTEWGAVAYLSHSKYGLNMNGYKNAILSDEEKNSSRDAYYTETGRKDSTTGNVSGIFYMGGGVEEYVAAVKDGSNYMGDDFVGDPLSIYGNKYFDVYNSASTLKKFNCRILGDATGEMGPFYQYADTDSNIRIHEGWYKYRTYFLANKWFSRGGGGTIIKNSMIRGSFAFNKTDGLAESYIGFRIVLGG